MRRRLALLLCVTGITGACAEETVLPPLLESADPDVVVRGAGATIVLGGRFDFTALKSDFAAGQTTIEVAGQLLVNDTAVMAQPAEGCGAEDCISFVLPNSLGVGLAEIQLVDRHEQRLIRDDLLQIRDDTGPPARIDLEVLQDGQRTQGGLRIGEPFTVRARIVDDAGAVVRSVSGSISIKFTGQDLGDVRLDVEDGAVRYEVSGADCDLALIQVLYDGGPEMFAAEQAISTRGGNPTLAPQQVTPAIVTGACQAVTDIQIEDACGNQLSRPGSTITVRVESPHADTDAMYFDSLCMEDTADATTTALPLFFNAAVGGTYTGHVLLDMDEIGTVDFTVQDSPYQIIWTETANSVTAGECATLTGQATENQVPAPGLTLTFNAFPNGLEVGATCGMNEPIVTDDVGNFVVNVRAVTIGSYELYPTNANGNSVRIEVNAGPAAVIGTQSTLTAGSCDPIRLTASDQFGNQTTFPANFFPMDVRILTDPGAFGFAGVGLSNDPNCDELEQPLSLESSTLYARWNQAPEVQLHFQTGNMNNDILAVSVVPAPAHHVSIQGPPRLSNTQCGTYAVEERDIYGNRTTSTPWSIDLTQQRLSPLGTGGLALYGSSNCGGGIGAMLTVSSNSTANIGVSMSNALPGQVFEINGASSSLGVLEGSARITLAGTCGDGRLDPGEDCDEGDRPSQGCFNCLRAGGYICGGEPSQCYLRADVIEISDACNPVAADCRNTSLGGMPNQAFIIRARPNGQLWPVENGSYQQTSRGIDMVFDPGAGLEGDPNVRTIELSGNATLNISGGRITKTGSGDAVHVAGDATLLLVNFDVGPTERRGIHVVMNGRLTYVRGTVFENKDGGIVLDNTQNTLLAHVLTYRNGQNNGYGVEVRRPRRESKFLHVSVLDSIDCGGERATPTVIHSSIITPHTELPEGCALDNSMAWFDGSISGNNNIDLMGIAENAGVDPTTGRLLSHSPCIDHVNLNSPGAMNPAAGVDIDGDRRPRGTLADCGADEF